MDALVDFVELRKIGEVFLVATFLVNGIYFFPTGEHEEAKRLGFRGRAAIQLVLLAAIYFMFGWWGVLVSMGAMTLLGAILFIRVRL